MFFLFLAATIKLRVLYYYFWLTYRPPENDGQVVGKSPFNNHGEKRKKLCHLKVFGDTRLTLKN
jgi:hypothetical protein